MDLTKKQKAIKYIVICALLLAGELLQNISGLLPEPWGARCFMLIPSLMLLTVDEDEITAAFLGLFAGALWDLSSGVHMGFNCIFFAVICFFASALVNHLIRDTFITNMIICTAVLALYCAVYWFCFIIIKGVAGAENTILSFYIPCAIFTAAVSPLAYLILKPLKKRLNGKTE